MCILYMFYLYVLLKSTDDGCKVHVKISKSNPRPLISSGPSIPKMLGCSSLISSHNYQQNIMYTEHNNIIML